MLEALKKAEAALPGLLADPAGWRSVFVDYHPPFVERLWRAIEIDGRSYRLYLHRIHACDLKSALFHPHPWPSAMRVSSGSYKMREGRSKDMQEPSVDGERVLKAGEAYEMTELDQWHAVAPLGEAAFSVMLTGEPWGRESHKSPEPLRPLDEREAKRLLDFFAKAYP